MNRKFDTRILILGLFVILGLLARPLAGPEYTGSVPNAEISVH